MLVDDSCLKSTLKPYISSCLYARQFLISPSTHTCLRIPHVHLHPPCAHLPSLPCPQGSGSCLHRAITLSGCVEPARFTASETISFPSALGIHFSRKDHFPTHPKEKKQTSQWWQVPALSSSHLPDEISFFAFHKAGWREWYLSPGAALPNHEHI